MSFTFRVYLLLAAATAALQWTPQSSGTTVRLRGISVVSRTVAWASGAGGAVLRTVDGGATWRAVNVEGAGQLDFRDVHGVDANTAYVLSIGEGEASRIYKTTDAGKSWTLQFQNRRSTAFFDCMAFWDAHTGIAMSDPVDGRYLLIRTSDGGQHWEELRPQEAQASLPGEAAFAASGTCIAVAGQTHVWMATGGGPKARVFRSTDRGDTWTVADTPITAGVSSAGIFSVAFRDERNGAAVGGDYQKERDPGANFAITADGGRTWTSGASLPGYRSAIAWAGSNLIAVGPSGSSISRDNGKTWSVLDAAGYDALGIAQPDVVFASGAQGRIGRLK